MEFNKNVIHLKLILCYIHIYLFGLRPGPHTGQLYARHHRKECKDNHAIYELCPVSHCPENVLFPCKVLRRFVGFLPTQLLSAYVRCWNQSSWIRYQWELRNCWPTLLCHCMARMQPSCWAAPYTVWCLLHAELAPRRLRNHPNLVQLGRHYGAVHRVLNLKPMRNLYMETELTGYLFLSCLFLYLWSHRGLEK